MEQAKNYALSIIAGLVVAIVFVLFEHSLSVAQNFLWFDTFTTTQNRLLVVPLVLVLSLIYFGVLHVLDRKHEKSIQHGLGDAPKPTIKNLSKILLIGFLSLLTGASLGPEAVLVPASLVIGAVIAIQFKSDKHVLSAAAFVALFVAFFSSLLGGLLGVFLLKKQNRQLDRSAFLAMFLSSVSAFFILSFLNISSYFFVSENNLNFSISFVPIAFILVLLGGLLVYILKGLITLVAWIKRKIYLREWYKTALVAGFGMSLIFLIGGEYVQFTGNEFIQPLFHNSSQYSFIGLVVIGLVKLFAMAWSHQFGYRGGLVFPFVLVLSIVVILVQRYMQDVPFVIALTAALVGGVIANKKTRTLF